MNNKKWFSLIEIIITVSIIVLLTVIWISSKKWYDENVSNTKVVSDTKTINNALEQYIQENKTLPMPGWNTNFYKVDTSYAHSYEDAETFWVYGSLTEETLPKQYLDVLPLDPRTNSYYSYGKTKATNEFEVASIQVVDWAVISKVIWNYTAEKWPYNLIREYNWPSFVYNWSEKNFPYNPDELVLIATDKAWKVYREWDTITTWLWEQKEIFFSDWSVSILEENSKITLNKLNFKWTDNLNTIVKLWLEAGKIWTKATKLNDNSQFEVYTTDSTAAVRWTIFWVVKDTNTQTILVEWKIEVTKNETATSTGTLETISVAKWEPVKIVETYKNNILTGISQSTTEIVPVFSKSEELRSDGTVSSIKNDITNSWSTSTTNEQAIVLTPDTIETICNSFKIDWICMDLENGLKSEWWNLYAYAPYNHEWDVNLYYSWWIIQTYSGSIYNNCLDNITWQCWINASSIWSLYYDKNNSFATYDNGIKWVFIDSANDTYNTSINDYIKYNWLNLSWNFAIEMNVSSDTITTNWNRLFFEWPWNNRLWISKSSTSDFIKINNNLVCTNCLPTNISSSFVKIKLINWLELSIWDIKYPLNSTYAINIANNIYIWSNLSSTQQINWILDYVKIYKK